jgi:hypothetical protein
VTRIEIPQHARVVVPLSATWRQPSDPVKAQADGLVPEAFAPQRCCERRVRGTCAMRAPNF